MASQDSERNSPIRAVPVTSVPPNPDLNKEATSSNPQITAPNKNKMPPKPRPTPSEFFKSKEAYIHANTSSTVSEIELRKLRERCHIPDTHLIRMPRSGEKMYQRPEGWTAVPVTILEKGVRFPLHPFLSTILGFIGVGFAQLAPNSYIHILAFIAFCHEAGVDPALDFFFTVYKVGQSRERGFKVISKQASRTGEKFDRRSLVNTPSSNRGWHEKWFCVKGPEISSLPNWATDEKISADFGDISEEREAEMIGLFDNFPREEWKFGLLSKQAWLYDHKLTLIRPSSSEIKELEDFIAGKSVEVLAEPSQQEALSEDYVVGRPTKVGAGPSQPAASSQPNPPTDKLPPINTETRTAEPEAEEPLLPELQLKPRRRKHAARKPKQICIPSDSEGFSESEPVVDPIPPSNVEPEPEPTPPVTAPTLSNIEPVQPAVRVPPPTVESATVRRSLLDMSVDARRQLLRVKKLRTQVTPLTAEDLRIPSSGTHLQQTSVEIHSVDEEEQFEPAATPSRKRKRSLDGHPSSVPVRSPVPNPVSAQSSSTENIYMDPSPPRNQPKPSPPRPSSSKFHEEATGPPTLWPRYNANFPFKLFDAFIQENDDARFVDHSNGDFLDEGMSYLAKANAVFGRLRPRQMNAESDEEAMKREINMLRATLAQEKVEHDSTIQANEILQRELTQNKEDLKETHDALVSVRVELKTTKVSEQKLANMNVRFVAETESLKTTNERLAEANQDLSIQLKEIQKKARSDRKFYRAKRRKLRSKIKALHERDPPMTEEMIKKIQADYRTSDELGAEILKVYYEGYEECRGRGKEKLTAASLDPSLLDSEKEDNV